jgi:hypothetical protein
MDSTGELLETASVDIEVPMRSRRRTVAVRRVALFKLWEFLVGVMCRTTTPSRLVIGRFGRLGHGELKGRVLGWGSKISTAPFLYSQSLFIIVTLPAHFPAPKRRFSFSCDMKKCRWTGMVRALLNG